MLCYLSVLFPFTMIVVLHEFLSMQRSVILFDYTLLGSQGRRRLEFQENTPWTWTCIVGGGLAGGKIVPLEGSILTAQFLGHGWFVYIGNSFWCCIRLGFIILFIEVFYYLFYFVISFLPINTFTMKHGVDQI